MAAQKTKPRHRDGSFKLLHFQFTANYGGDETNSLLLCQKLPGIHHEIAVHFGEGPMERAWTQAGAHVRLLRLSQHDRGGLQRAIAATVESSNPDAVFLSSISLMPVVLGGLSKFSGLVLCHTGNPWAPSFKTRVKFWLARCWFPSAKNVMMVHCSEYVKRSFQAALYFRHYRHEVAVSAGAAANLSTIIAIHQPRPVTKDTEVRLGMLARLDRIKNHRLVISAFGLLATQYPEARLEFIGKGDELDTLKQHAADLNLAGKVKFWGQVEDAFAIVREWDLFLYATTKAEGFGAALAEAMSIGMPCVVTDVGPMREVGGEGGAVRYVDAHSPEHMASVAAELLGDLPSREALSHDSRKRAQSEFDAARFAEKVKTCLLG